MVSSSSDEPAAEDSQGPPPTFHPHGPLARPVDSHRPLLPVFLARLVSRATQSAHFYIRLGDDVGACIFEILRLATVFTLNGSRDISESLLVKVYDEFVRGPSSEKPEAEAHLQRAVSHMHEGFSNATLDTLATLHLIRSWLWLFSEHIKLCLSTINQMFGMTDTSCALGSALGLVVRECGTPWISGQGESISQMDMLAAAVALLYLQRFSRVWLKEERRMLVLDEVVWDAVILYDGSRVDIDLPEDLSHRPPPGETMPTAPSHPCTESSNQEDTASAPGGVAEAGPTPGAAQHDPRRFSSLDQQPSLRRRDTTSGSHYFSVHGSQQPMHSLPERVGLDTGPASTPTDKLDALRWGGVFPGIFPERHFLANAMRYMRFSSATYGCKVARYMGIVEGIPTSGVFEDKHSNVRTLAHHARISLGNVLLYSFCDEAKELNEGTPLLAHYLCLDHLSKAVVLAFRGTLCVYNALTDVDAEHVLLRWQGKEYKVHKGIYESAKLALYANNGKVLRALGDALEKYPKYGVVVAGHSLGGAAAALVGIMLSRPSRRASRPFVTSAEPHTCLVAEDPSHPQPEPVPIPGGRPIHVFAYGPPATISSHLRNATRDLITSFVYDDDVVPCLSLGMFHNFQGAALALRTQSPETKKELFSRIGHGVLGMIINRYRSPWARHVREEGREKRDGEWAYAVLKILRANMMSDELVPPGEVFVLEDTRLATRDKGVVPGKDMELHLGAPACRMVMKYVWEVEKRFGEMRFDESMLLDHGPERYERGLRRLMAGLGVIEV